MIHQYLHPGKRGLDTLPRACPPCTTSQGVSGPVVRVTAWDLAIQEEARLVAGVIMGVEQGITYDGAVARLDLEARQESQHATSLLERFCAGHDGPQRAKLFGAHDDCPRGGCDVKCMQALSLSSSSGFSSTNLPSTHKSSR